MNRTDYEILCSLALNRIFGYKPAHARALIARFGSAGAVFSQTPQALDEAFGPFSPYRSQVNPDAVEDASREFERLRSLGCLFVPMDTPGYPPLLAECEDAPVGLYFRGGSPPEEVFGKRKEFISVVGTRDISPYGREWTARLVGAMGRSARRPTVVSGFAMGVDITAHLAALEAGLPTVAVLPVGIDDIYPRRHSSVAEKLAETPGCAVVTDFPPGTAPVAFNFLRRNRIIAGISRATILTESKAKGGGTMTARLAASYGREVFALPGRIDDIRSAGCNRLIMEKIAEPITDAGALPGQLGLGSIARSRGPALEESLQACYGSADALTLSRLTDIALLIRKQRGIDTERICSALGLDWGSVSAALCLLESDGFIVTDLLGRCSINTNFS